MKTSARQPAQKKRRIESRIVGQHITDEPSTNAHEACYAIRTLVIVTVGGAAYGFTATFGPVPCPGLPGPFLPLLRSRHQVPAFRRIVAHALDPVVRVRTPFTQFTKSDACWC